MPPAPGDTPGSTGTGQQQCLGLVLVGCWHSEPPSQGCDGVTWGGWGTTGSPGEELSALGFWEGQISALFVILALPPHAAPWVTPCLGCEHPWASILPLNYGLGILHRGFGAWCQGDGGSPRCLGHLCCPASFPGVPSHPSWLAAEPRGSLGSECRAVI